MILRALNFQGYLDISAPEVLGSTEYEWLGSAAPFRRTMKSGDIVIVPDEFYRFPNITNAVSAGLLEIVAYDKRKEQIVIHAEITGGTGTPGTKYVTFDVHGGEDTAIIADINGVPSLVFEDGCDHRSKWTVTIPEDYVTGTPIYIEVFWSFPSGEPADVLWHMEYKAVPAGSPMTDPVFGIYYLQPALVSDKLYTTGASLIIPPTDLAAGRLLMISVRRTATDPSDTLNAPAYIHIVKMNYTGLVFSSP